MGQAANAVEVVSARINVAACAEMLGDRGLARYESAKARELIDAVVEEILTENSFMDEDKRVDYRAYYPLLTFIR